MGHYASEMDPNYGTNIRNIGWAHAAVKITCRACKKVVKNREEEPQNHEPNCPVFLYEEFWENYMARKEDYDIVLPPLPSIFNWASVVITPSTPYHECDLCKRSNLWTSKIIGGNITLCQPHIDSLKQEIDRINGQ